MSRKHAFCRITSRLLVLLCSLTGVRSVSLPNTTHSGYLPVHKADGSQIFYSYYEATKETVDDSPVILWLQGGPGCAGHFGNFYELGPQLVTENLTLVANPGAWNREAGLLFVDQPVGTGFSISGSGRIPDDETEMAADLFAALQHFFRKHSELSERPFVITGESYAGKYVPSIGHFILQMERLFGLRGKEGSNALERQLPADVTKLGPPNFHLVGLAIGNGLTDPVTQVQTHADTAFFQGLIDTQQRLRAMAMQLQVSQAISEGAWAEASNHREALLEFLKRAIGAGTMLDYRRTLDYDPEKRVDQYLNQPEVKKFLGAKEDIDFASCSDEVGKVLGADIMKSVAYVIPDLLAHYPLLLYQGAFDAQDGPATSEAWIQALQWPGRQRFIGSPRAIWRADLNGSVPHFRDDAASDSEAQTEELGRVVGYWREAGPLTHVVIRHAGHMVPHDDPLTAQAMIESWLQRSVLPSHHGPGSVVQAIADV